MQKKELSTEVEQMKIALQEAIADAESAEEVAYGGFDGQLLSKSGGKHTYQFIIKTYWDVDDNAKVYVVDAERELKVDARVLSREANTLMIATAAALPDEKLSHVFFVEDKAWLLKRQLGALSQFRETSAEFGAKALGLIPVKSGRKAIRGKLGQFVPHPDQEKAIAHGLGSEKTLIVGPPGTGKTTTLSDLICRYLRQDLSVLLVSHTNIATDNAFIRLVQAMLASKKAELRTLVDEGLVVRAGDPRHVALRTGQFRGLTVNALAEEMMGKQAQTRERLEQSLPKLDRKREDLEHQIRKQEKAWQPRRASLQKEMAPIEEELSTLQTKRQEQERRDQEFYTVKAREREEVQKTLGPLRKKYQELVETRKMWVNESNQRNQTWENARGQVETIRAMGRVQRMFSAYRGYDFAAADREVARLHGLKRQADTMVGEADRQIAENVQAQREPTDRLRRIEHDVQVLERIKKEHDISELASLSLLQKRLAPLTEEMQQGEQVLQDLREQMKQISEEQERIRTRLEELKSQQETLKMEIVADAQLVATTVTGVYMNAHLLEREFDVVVIDELSMISVIGVLLAASRATKHLVGAGDPMQLSPIVKLEHEEKAPHAKEWLGKDLFTYLEISIFDAISGEKECCLLTEQGRAHPSIIAPINHYIYQDMLTSRAQTKSAPGIHPRPEWPLVLVDTTGSEARCIKPSKSRPRENEYHANLSVTLAKLSLESLPPRSANDDESVPRVAIIAPYRSQVQLVQRKLREVKLAHAVHVGTINTVQALEFEVVVLDTVEAPGGPRPWNFTFDTTLDEYQMATGATRKLNVAWTRARHKLIVIAHRRHLQDHLPYRSHDDPKKKQHLLMDLVEWTYRECHLSSTEILSSSMHLGGSR